MESRKRQHVDDSEPIAAKKRILASANGSPLVNGAVAAADEPNDSDNLELFRKEAIFRRMKHYSREYERSQIRIAELERRKSTCEVGLAAMSACWSQLTEAIRLVARPEDATANDDQTRDLFDLAISLSDHPPPGLVPALEDKMQYTRGLLTHLVQSGGEVNSKLLHDDAYVKCQKAQTECAALRSELCLVRAKLQDSETQREQFHADLLASESRIDRLRSGTVSAMQTTAKAPINLEVKPEETVEPPQQPPSSLSPSQPNGHVHDSSASDDWKDIAETRETRIHELERELATAREANYTLKLSLRSIPPTHITSSPQYLDALNRATRAEAHAQKCADETSKVKDDLQELVTARTASEEAARAVNDHVKQELKAMLAKRDAENVRLREQRDQQAAEILERKQKDSVKIASLREFKALAESRSERIVVLQSEVKRLQALLAANAGNEDLLSFLLGEHPEGFTFIDDLKAKASAAEARVLAMERSLAFFNDDNPDLSRYIKAEADARQELATVSAQLDRYRQVYGDTSTYPPDVQALAAKLQSKEDENHKLRLLESQHTQAETSLYAELDKLSAAWEALDRQVKSKVFDLAVLEDRLSKSLLEKAKSDNKFYAAMRDKEASETSRKLLQKEMDKKAQLVETQNTSVQTLSERLSQSGTELQKSKHIVESHLQQIAELQTTIGGQKAALETATKTATESQALVKEVESRVEKKLNELRGVQEGFTQERKEIERQLSKLKKISTETGAQREIELQGEVDKAMKLLKCSTCNLQMRSTILTKCLHTFCRQCVDARISTRQRKCPACNLPFAQSDVQQLFFQ